MCYENLLAVLLLLVVGVRTQNDPSDCLPTQPEIVEAWQDMRFGMFFCMND